VKKVLLLILLICLALTISTYAKPKPVNELVGIKLGDNIDQIKTVLGEPSMVTSKMLIYDTKGKRSGIIILISKEQRVIYVDVCDPSYKINLQGVSIGTDAKTVNKIFGQPDGKFPSTLDKSWFIWEYFPYKTAFTIKAGKVYSIAVGDFKK